MINLTIKGQKLTVCQEMIASQTIDFLEAQATFTEEWNGLIKFVHFTKGEENYIVQMHNDKISKNQHLNLTKGEWAVFIHGNEVVDGVVKERITTTIGQLYVKATGCLYGEPLPITPPSLGEQILGTAEDAKETANKVGADLNAEKERAINKENKLNDSISGNTEEINSLKENKVDKEAGKSLLSDTEIERLGTLHNYDDTNVKKDINDLKNNKVDKEAGKGLSANDFTNEYKTLVDIFNQIGLYVSNGYLCQKLKGE